LDTKPAAAAALIGATAPALKRAAKLMHSATSELHRLEAAQLETGEPEQVQRLIAGSPERLQQMSQSPAR